MGQSNIDYGNLKKEIREYTKGLAINEFPSFVQIAKKFGVCSDAVGRWLKDAVRIADNGIYIENDIIYVSQTGLARLLKMTVRHICERIGKMLGLDYIYLYNYQEGDKKLHKCRFYLLDEIFKRIPSYQKRHEEIKSDSRLDDSHILRKQPKNLDKTAYLVLCAMIIFRIKWDRWPRYHEISRSLLGYKGRKLDIRHIKRIIEEKLIPEFLIKIEIPKNLNYTAYKVRKAPRKLLYTKKTIIVTNPLYGDNSGCVEKVVEVPYDFVDIKHQPL
ncbi:MAG: hypothetical protein ACD_58C00285G0003 [uncultured bacterium]|nr:MAG: hypothetical protein ACD_58C00285G0003 [uncultured bacterium]